MTAEDVSESMAISITPIEPPAEKWGVISLPGVSANGSPEEWLKVEIIGVQPRGNATSQGAEVVVRNVSRPTLVPFWPDPAKATGAAMIVMPGGGFIGLGMDREGYPVSRWLAERGIAAFLLKYRVAPTPGDWRELLKTEPAAPLVWRVREGKTVGTSSDARIEAAIRAAREDVVEAMRYLRHHAPGWGLSSDRIGVVGFSAGAIGAISVALDGDRITQPNLVASIYGGLTDGAIASATAPAAFIATAADDSSVPPAASLSLYETWQAAGASAELHVFENGGHGFGMLHQEKRSDQWPTLFDRWLAVHGFGAPYEGMA